MMKIVYIPICWLLTGGHICQNCWTVHWRREICLNLKNNSKKQKKKNWKEKMTEHQKQGLQKSRPPPITFESASDGP